MTKKKVIIITVSIVGVLGVLAGVLVPVSINSINHPSAPKVNSSKKHIACIGDSVTFGNGVWPFHHYQSYPAYLNKYVGNEYQVLNYGLSGRTLMNEADHPYTSEKFYNISHEVKADVYIIMLGSNDSKNHNWKYAGENGINYKNELKEFANSYISLENSPTVYLMQPPKAFKKAYKIDNNIISNDIHRIVKEVGDELSIGVIDIYTLTENHRGWFMDGVHPNSNGDKQIANYIYSQIEGSL